MPKLVDKEQRKFDIMQAAVSKCYEDGLSRLSIGDIADATGVSRTLFYQYFTDKNDILDYALDYALEVVGRDYERLSSNVFLSAPEKIFRLFENILSDAITERKTIAVLLSIVSEREPGLRKSRLRIWGRIYSIRQSLKRILSYGIERKEIRPLDVKAMSTVLTHLALSLVQSLTLGKSSNSAAIRHSLSILLKGLMPDKNENQEL